MFWDFFDDDFWDMDPEDFAITGAIGGLLEEERDEEERLRQELEDELDSDEDDYLY